MSKELDEFYKKYSARIIAMDDTPLVKVMDGGKFKLLSIEEYEEMTNKLADLETKLAEKEKIEFTDTINFVETSEPDRVAEYIDELLEKLAQAQKTIEIQNKLTDALIEENLDYSYDLTDIAHERAEELAESWEEDYQQEIEQLKQQLAEKEKRIKKLNLEAQKYYEDAYCNDFHNQDKISFTVDKLVGVQKYISDNAVYIEEESFGREINDFIDNQIKAIKGEVVWKNLIQKNG